jgi:tRNA threonylcarbamoyladenosine biosynthesis protein TsaE
MKAVVKPMQQPGFGRGQIDAGHADLGESQFDSPRLNASNQLSAVDVHRPIVETRVWKTEADTQAFAAALAASGALGNAFIELHGDLGAGKTTLVRHLLHALGVQGRVKSPTYAVMEPHEVAGLQISHFDFYRFSDPREWEDAGLRDVFAAPGLKLAEWPENARGFLPPADLAIRIGVLADETRQASLHAHTATGAALLKALPA